jgi:hypothetical protein
MAMNRNSRKSIAPLAVAIVIGLLLFGGVELLVQAAAIPLGTLTVRVINAILIRGWGYAMLLSPPSRTLDVVAFTAVEGLFPIAIGLGIGIMLVPRDPQE